MTNTVDSSTSYTNQNDNPRGPHLSSSAFPNNAVGSPDYDYWWVHGLSRTAGSPVTWNTPLFFYDIMGPPTTTTTR